MNFRTDLALELKENIKKINITGIESDEISKGSLKITSIKVTSDSGAKEIGKPIGEYITIETAQNGNFSSVFDDDIQVISDYIARYVSDKNSLVLVIGLGNRNITPDALGPFVATSILTTRHLSQELIKSIGLDHLRPVASIAPGVLGQTGIETGEISASVVKQINPSAVIVVDALAARSTSRLGSTIQISNTGIIPGSGVLNSRKALNRETLGIPVIMVGIPTVVDANTIANDLLADSNCECKDKLLQSKTPLMVTPKDVDIMIERGSKIVSMAINKALQPHLSFEDISMLTS